MTLTRRLFLKTSAAALALAKVYSLPAQAALLDQHVAVVSSPLGWMTNFTKSGFGTPKACIVLITDEPPSSESIATKDRVSIYFSDFKNQRYAMMNQGNVGYSGVVSPIVDGVRLTPAKGSKPSTDELATVIMFGGSDLDISLDVVKDELSRRLW